MNRLCVLALGTVLCVQGLTGCLVMNPSRWGGQRGWQGSLVGGPGECVPGHRVLPV